MDGMNMALIVVAALLALSYVLYLRHYKLDEPEYDRICRELQSRREGKKAILTCSYAIRWFRMHPEYQDLLEDPEEEAGKAQMLAGPACGIRR